MILLVFVVLGVVVGFISGGRVSYIREHTLHALWLPIAAFLVKGLAPYAVSAFSLPVGPVQVVVCVLQYGMLAAFAALNWRYLWWPAVFGAGTLMNFLVIVLNGGAMPVSDRVVSLSPAIAARFASGEVFGYTLETAATRVPLLGDILFVRLGSWDVGFASIGDLFIGAGAALLCIQLLRPAKHPANDTVEDTGEGSTPAQLGSGAPVATTTRADDNNRAVP